MKKYKIDPPSGYMYGFPMEVSETITTQEIRDLLRRQKYPEIPLPPEPSYAG